MKKNNCILILLTFFVGIFSGCGNAIDVKSDKLNIVCTIFPQYDWTKQILNERLDNVNLKLLMLNGVDLHNYQPTAEDIIKIEKSDLFIYVGGESDSWVEELINNSEKKINAINLMEVIGDAAKEEELVEGMETHQHEHEEAEHEEHEHEEHEAEYDEHVWLSLKNADKICEAISEALCEIDKENAEAYSKNYSAYSTKLKKLDETYVNMVSTSERKVVLFGDRFPFRYLTDDYDIDYYAAFAGCSAETEASFETVIFLSNKADELNLPVIFSIDNSDKAVAEAVINNTKSKNQKLLTLDSMQSVKTENIEAGVTYISIMQSNYEALKEALN